MRQNHHPTNSREWWEEYFREDWDAHGGGAQTHHFMERLVQELPAPEIAFLNSTPVSILDWGCAFGEGVELLARSFPQSQVTGLDFASRAVDQARIRRPDRHFIYAERGDIPGEFDVILTSNCLEHFENPLAIVRTHLESCRNLYIALVPYDESPRSEHHNSRLREDSIPEHVGPFVRLCAKRIDVDPAYWSGQQLLVVYGSESYVSERAGFARKASEQTKWDQYYASLPLFVADEATQSFGPELVERVSELLPAGSSVLEAGCGGGWQSLALARSGKFKVTLMDFSREALKYARRLFELENQPAEFVYGDVFTLREPRFDLVFNAGVLEHYTLNEQAAFLRGMASNTRKYVLALVPNRLCYWYWLWRLQKSAAGDWPFGKEVPLADFSAAFEASGLQYLGQTFMGEKWADLFVEGLVGITPQLKEQILEITRSPLTPKEQRSYLVAGLGAVATQDHELPLVWTPSPAPEDMRMAEMHAALADALALRIGEEQRSSKLEARLLEKDGAIEALAVQVAATERRAIESENRAIDGERRALESEGRAIDAARREAEKEAGLRDLARQASEQRGAIASLTAQLAEHEEASLADQARHEKVVKSLTERLASEAASALSARAEANQTAAALTALRREKEAAVSSLSAQVAQKERELEKITSTLGWRILNAYGPIKYRYLLPIYRMLGLPPYRRSSKAQASASDPPVESSASGIQPMLSEPSAPTPGNELNELRASIARESNAYDIVCFPIIDWDFRFQRPQQLMSRFASAGHRVFYLSQTFRPSGEPYVIVEKQHNVYEVSLRGQPRNVYTESLDDRTREELFKSIDSLRRDLALGATVSVVQLPFWRPLVDRTRAEFAWPIVYDCMDHHAGFSTNRPTMIEHESRLLASADLVVVSSLFLKEEVERHASSALLVRNACEYEHFARAGSSKGGRPVIGYYGAIADWFDSDLVADLAERRPDWDFVLVGSTFSADTRRLSKLPNVSLPGEKHYSTIPDWLGTFDVAMLPFKRIPLTEATNPVKAYEILASGKPLVSAPIPEMVLLAPLVRLASTAEEFEREISAALSDQSRNIVEERRNFAKENTWEKRYETLAPAVAQTFPKVSIIIVTYNSVELNRLCLESLYARTEWPNYEVIVVDNASSDETPTYLKQAEKTFPNLRVILNPANLGFAPANNIGLEHATGEHIVLLNNDTIVTRGWLSALIRRLIADPTIGLIGPVTNAIANEAKVDVGYQKVDEMPSWAARYVREHDGDVFPIPMLAMFCVAMRRAVFDKAGPLDERFAIGMFEDDDYCRRIRGLGYKLVCARDSFIHHWQRASFRILGEDEYLRVYEENRRKYENKWRGERASDSRPGEELVDERYREQLETVLERARSSKSVVIFLPSIGWNIHLFQRPHHLARTFARKGYVSIFDSSNSHDNVNGFEEIDHNLFLFHGPENVLHEIPSPVLWAFPYNLDRKDGYPSNARTVYDWIDDLDVFPYDRALLERNHRRGLRESTIVACVARILHEQALAVRPDAIYLPNGVEYDRFAGDSAAASVDREFESLHREGKPIAGYYGALAEWFDYELLNEVARLRPDWNFVLIGQSLDDSVHRRGASLPSNVKWIGPRPYESLPGYLGRFDVAMIPFKINRITEATSPLKLYEYMAGAKPIIATPMPECLSFPAVNIARDAEEFAQALDRAREQGLDPEFRAQLRAIACENAWGARVEAVAESLGREAGQRSGPNPIAASAIASASTTERGPEGHGGVSGAVATAAEPRADEEEDIDSVAAAEPARGPEAKIAERFVRFKTPRNVAFFNALAAHFVASESDPCLPMYFEFAITCNERGRQVAKLLMSQTALRDKHCLDIGCAYGGFLVAFAEQQARVVGIDIDETLLGLARTNLQDNQLDAPLLLADATRAEQLVEFRGRFDLITCNDVIEHVEDPQQLLTNIADMLSEHGLVYFEIPNRHAPGHVLRDGHYQLFGITLLDYLDARDYYAQHAPGVPYSVRHYLSLDQYAEMFERAGMQLEILEANYQDVDLETALNDVIELREGAETGLAGVPESVRSRVQERLAGYLGDVQALPHETESERREFLLRYGMGFWRVLGRKRAELPAEEPPAAAAQTQRKLFTPIDAVSYHPGRCNVCGLDTRFYYTEPALYRESLVCMECGTTSRYRSIARGILRAVRELAGVEAASIAELSKIAAPRVLKIYDTQAPFYFDAGAYPIPDLLARCGWLDVRTSLYRPQQRLGKKLGPRITNQNLEALTFKDNYFDIVLTSDVMEHVRLDFRAHQEIRRVLKPGGVYVFTVPHLRDRRDTFYRVAVIDPADPAKDVFLTEKEFHGDANADDGRALSYRAYGTDLDETLKALGFAVDYCKTDFTREGVMNTELFYCRLAE